MKIHVLTAVSRPDNLEQIGASINAARERAFAPVAIEWHRLEDLGRVHVGGQNLKNMMLAKINNGWVCILDDDTVMHHRYLNKVYRAHLRNPGAEAIVVSQRRTNGTVLEAKPENMRVGCVDAGQVLMRRSLIGNHLIPETYAGDGQWIQDLLYGHQDVVYLPEVLSLHNALSGIDVSEPPERMGAV